MTAPVFVQGMACAIPEHRLPAEAFERLAVRLCAHAPREGALIRAVVRRSGIEERATVLPPGGGSDVLFYLPPNVARAGPSTAARMEVYETLAPALALAAARGALAEAGLASGEITHLVTASCTGFSAPGVDLRLVAELALPPETARVNVGFMGCHGAINALRVARALGIEDPHARVLVVAAEVCTLHFQYGLSRDDLLPNALFADGAAAMVVSAAAAPGALRLLSTASCVIPASADAMTWRITDTGFRMTLDSRVPDLIAAHTGAFVRGALAAHGLSTRDVAGWAIHPGGPRVVESVLHSLSLPASAGEAARDVLRRHGNMSSATVLFVLEELLRAGARGPIAALAFGPGLAAELALFDSGACG